MYTLGAGATAENGRLRGVGGSTLTGCELEIAAVDGGDTDDAGQWECEVGAVIGEDFSTATDRITLEVNGKKIVKFNFFASELLAY